MNEGENEQNECELKRDTNNKSHKNTKNNIDENRHDTQTYYSIFIITIVGAKYL